MHTAHIFTLTLASVISLIGLSGSFLVGQARGAIADEALIEIGDGIVLHRDDLRVGWRNEEHLLWLAQFQFSVSRDEQRSPALRHASVQEVERQGDTIRLTFTTEGDAAAESTLAATVEPSQDGLVFRYHINYDGPAEGLSRPRFAFDYLRDEDQIGSPLRWDAKPAPNERRRLLLDYGPGTLELEIDRDDFSWMGMRSTRSLPMNLSFQDRQDLRDRVVRFRLAFQPADSEALRASAEKLLNTRRGDASAWLEALRYTQVGEEQSKTLEEWDHKLEALSADMAELTKQIGEAQAHQLASWQRAQAFADRLESLSTEIQGLVAEHRDEIYAEAKAFHDRMGFHAGLALTSDPRDRLDRWALFRFGLYRLGGHRMAGETREAQIEQANAILEETDRFGGRAILSVYVDVEPTGPADMSFSHHLLPTERPSFYKDSFHSVNVRKAWGEPLREWVRGTASAKNVVSYVIGNEPFWSSRPSPIYGYDLPTTGARPERFLRAVEAVYGNFENWREALDERPQASLYPWDRPEDVTIPESELAGLTFIDFLKQRYDGNLSALNESWLTDGQEAIERWDDVFPPLPQGTKTREGVSVAHFDIADDTDHSAAPRPRREDVPAWTDWIRFWPHAVNNHLLAVRDMAREAGENVALTSNCVTGQFMNNYLGAGATTGLLPWVTPRELDTVAIDFYALGFTQAYLRSLAGVADGRPIRIHETGGSETEAITFMTLFSFAYGADGLLFFRRDHLIPPHVAIEMTRALHALDDEPLQRRSSPVTDGLAVIYSLDSLYLSDAETGTGGRYLDAWHGGVLALHRLQVLYDVLSDEQVAAGVPDHVKVIAAPGAEALNDETLQMLKRFVEDGGTLVVDETFASRDPHGRPRADQDRDWMNDHERVVHLSDAALQDWRQTLPRSNQDPQLALSENLPDVIADPLEKAIHAAASRTVTYRTPEGDLAPRQAAARRADEALYVFVDPWAEQTELHVRGDYRTAHELYSRQDLPVQQVDGQTRVTVNGGPAVVKLMPADAAASRPQRR